MADTVGLYLGSSTYVNHKQCVTEICLKKLLAEVSAFVEQHRHGVSKSSLYY